MTKKILIFIAILAVAAMLSAENQTTSCESEYGTCSFELSDEAISQNCVCRDGREFCVSDPVFEGYKLPSEEGCLATIDNYCKKIPAQCKNDAGACEVDNNGKYECNCYYVDGKKTGSGYFSEDGCNEILIETCGTETPTPRKICAEEILNECVSCLERIKNTCSKEPINDINEILDTPIDDFDYSTETAITVHELADCCRFEYWKNEYKRESDCIATFDSCKDKECCECIIQVGGDGDPATPATDTEAPAEKEENKSGGCSLLFV